MADLFSKFNLPSSNQLMAMGLGLMGGGLQGRPGVGLANAMQGYAQGRQMDMAEEDRQYRQRQQQREEAAWQQAQRQRQDWNALFGRGQPNLARTPGIAPPMPGDQPIDLVPPAMRTAPGDQLAMAEPRNMPATNPMLAGLPQGAAPLLQAMGPEAGGRFLLDRMTQSPAQRRIIQGADGYQYFSDTGERVLPDVQARDPDVLSQEALEQRLQIRQAGRPETNVTVGGRYGTIPQGYMLQEGPEGARLVAIPGGPADIEQQQTAETQAAAEQQRQRQSDLMLDEIDRTFALMDEAVLPTTGSIGGGLLSALPETNAGAISSRLQTIKSNIGFDRLQQMRESSPTGGALGNVTEGEIRRLESVMGNLEQSQREEEFRYNLNRLRETYLDTIHGAGNRPGEAAETTSAYESMSPDQLLNLDPASIDDVDAYEAALKARGLIE